MINVTLLKTVICAAVGQAPQGAKLPDELNNVR